LDQNQPASPFNISNLIVPVLGSTIRALSDRPGQTEAQRQARAGDVLNMIMSFQPRDVVEMTLASQAVVYNELIADSAVDIFRAVDPAAKVRSLSAVMSMGRLTQGHLDRLAKRGNRPYRTEFVAPEAAVEPVVAQPRAAEPPAVEPPKPAEPPPAVEPVQPIAAAQTAPASGPSEQESAEPAYQRPVQPESWLDEPYEQLILETPALVHATRMAMALTKVPPRRDNGIAPRPRTDLPPISHASAGRRVEAAASGD
jgi:hypothetical protein